MWILLATVDIQRIISSLHLVDVTYIAFALLLGLGGTLLGVLRWQVSLTVQQIHAPFKTLLSLTLVSGFVGLVLPTAFGGDAVRGYDLYRYTKKPIGVAASIFFERICGLISLIIVGSLGLIVGYEHIDRDSLIPSIVVVYFALLAAIYVAFNENLTRISISLISKIPGTNWVRVTLEKLSNAIHAYKGQRKTWVGVMLISLIFQVVGILYYYLVALSLSLQISFVTFFILIPLITIVTLVPISVGGIGVKEGMFVLLFSQFGVSTESALLISLIGTALYMVFVLAGGIIYVTRARAERPE